MQKNENKCKIVFTNLFYFKVANTNYTKNSIF
jgi:hypothetical protein